MNYGMIAIILLFVCLVVIAAEFLWLSVIAEKQESHTRKYDDAYRRISSMMDTILYAPTNETMQNEILSLKKFVGSDPIKMDTISTKTIQLLTDEDTDDAQKAAVCAINDVVKPLSFYKQLLYSGDPYEKAYACRKVAAFYEESELPVIRKLAFSKNKDLSYNAAMALAVFGDEDTLAEFILKCEKNYSYSHRIILELMSTYTGDIRTLAQKVFSKCDDYIGITVIKGLSDHNLVEFEDLYIDGLNSKNANLKAACIRALGNIGKPEYEHAIITAAHDKNWFVRSAAVKALGNIGTDSAKKALVEATKDQEWWVRYNAAKTLVEVDPELTYIETVLRGYDKYGADAVKYILYKTYPLE